MLKDFVVQMYAEYLLPENTVVDVIRMNFLQSTFCIQFKDTIDFDVLNKRHQKKSKLRNQEIEIKKAFKTFTLIIAGQNIDVIQAKLTESFPQTLKTDTTPFLYLEKLDNFVVCQFEDDNIELLAKIVLEENSFVTDICYNFDIINHKDLFNKINQTKKKAIKEKKLVNKSIQTDSDTSSNFPNGSMDFIQINLEKHELITNCISLIKRGQFNE